MPTPTPRTDTRPPIIGITGGIGAGKSAALDAFGRAGAATFSADRAVHAIYAEDEDVRAAVRGRWGDEVLDADGSVRRDVIAAHVFGAPEELAWLEGLLHPRVAQAWLRFVEEAAASAPRPRAIAAEVPLLYEAGLEERYDRIVAISAPLDLRLERVGERAHGGSADARARAAHQMPESEKLRRADYGYVNDGSLADLDAFVRRVLDEVA